MPNDEEPPEHPNDDAPRKLLRRLMAEGRWDPTNLSKRMGFGGTHIRDYLERHRPEKLTERSRDALAAVFPAYKPDDFKPNPPRNPPIKGSVINSPLASDTTLSVEEERDKMTLYDRLFADVFIRLEVLEAKLRGVPVKESSKHPPRPRGRR